MAVYTYVAQDLRTGAVLNELPLTGTSFGGVLNGAGDLQATLPLDAGGSALGVSELLRASTPDRTALYVDRDGVIVWAGIIWTRKSQSATSRVLDIGGLEFWSYFRHRRLTVDLSVIATDQATIVKTLIDHAQGKPGGNIRVAVPTVTTGKLRDRTWRSYERKNIGEAVEQLSQVIDGFDFAIDTAYVAGVLTSTFNIGFPRRGRTLANTGHMFELPGNILNYSLAEDGTVMANSISGLGQGDGDTKLVVTETDTTQIDAGWPLLEDTVSLGDVKQQATLDAHVLAEVSRRSTTPPAFTITVDPTQDPVFGSWITGDDCRVRITDTRYPDTFDEYMRIVAWHLTPGGGDTPESLVLTVMPATSATSGTQRPASDATHQAEIEQRIATLESAPQADLTAVRDGAFVVLDTSGRVVLRMGKQADGKIGMRIFDPATGVVQLSVGQLADNTFGLEQIDVATGNTVPLSAIALGTRATTIAGPLTTASVTYVDLGAETVTVKVTSTGSVTVESASLLTMPANGGQGLLGLSIDGAAPGGLGTVSNWAAAIAYGMCSRVNRITGLTPGDHTFQLWFAAGGVGTTTFQSSTLVVRPY